MKNTFSRPEWVPQVESGMRLLITGATGGLGRAVVGMLVEGSDCTIGAHGASQNFNSKSSKVIPLNQTFENHTDCQSVVEEFVKIVSGLDALIVLSGSILIFLIFKSS